MEKVVKKLKVKKVDIETKKNLEFLEGVNIPDLDFLKMFKEDYHRTKRRNFKVKVL